MSFLEDLFHMFSFVHDIFGLLYLGCMFQKGLKSFLLKNHVFVVSVAC